MRPNCPGVISSFSLGKIARARMVPVVRSTWTTLAAGSGTVTDTQLLAALTNIQLIDFTQGGVDASLTLSGAQISQINGGAANTLTLTLDAGDAVAISDPVANYTSSTIGNTTSYTIYDDAAHSNVIAHLALVA